MDLRDPWLVVQQAPTIQHPAHVSLAPEKLHLETGETVLQVPAGRDACRHHFVLSGVITQENLVANQANSSERRRSSPPFRTSAPDNIYINNGERPIPRQQEKPIASCQDVFDKEFFLSWKMCFHQNSLFRKSLFPRAVQECWRTLDSDSVLSN